MSGNLKSELTTMYIKFGYVIIKDAISKDVLRNFQNEVLTPFGLSHNSSSTLSQGIIDMNDSDKIALHRAHNAANQLVCLSEFDSVFAGMVRELSGSSAPVYSITKAILLGIPNDERLVYNFHQESNFMHGFSNIFNFHFPFLNDATVENGTMSVLQGSNRLGNLQFRESKFSDDSYTNRIPTDIEEIQSEYVEIDCVLGLGDVLVFDQHLIHKSNKNKSAECRLVGVSRLTQDPNGKFI